MTGEYFKRPAQVLRPRRNPTRPPPRAPREAAPICPLGEALLEDAAALWTNRWSLFYSSLDSPLAGAPTSKTLTARLGLMAVCVTHALQQHAPEGATWRASLALDDNDQPAALALWRDEVCTAIPITLTARSVAVGERSVFMPAPRAAFAALRAICAAAGEFFALPTRRAS